MHVRVARFEGIDTTNIDRDMEEFRKMVHMQERPEGMPEETYSTLKNGVKRMMSLVDRDAGVSFDLAFTDNASAKTFLTWHQSPVDPPNGFMRTLGDAVAGAPAGEPAFASTTKPVTHIPDPTPAVRAIKKRLVKYKRKDGTDLSFTLYTPPAIRSQRRSSRAYRSTTRLFGASTSSGRSRW